MAQLPDAYPAKYWRKLEDGRIQCDLCPRLCKLYEGQRAFCFVRARHGDQIVSTTYGRSSGFCIDPVEKKGILIISCRELRRCLSERAAATSGVNFARTGTSARRANLTCLQSAPARKILRAPRNGSDAQASPTHTTIPQSFTNMRSTRRSPAERWASRILRSPPAMSVRSRAPRSIDHGCGQYRSEGIH